MRRAPLAVLLFLATSWSLPALAAAESSNCVSGFRADVHPREAFVNMSWEPVESARFYDVHRSIDGGPLEFLIRVEAGFPSLGDEGTYGNLTYAIAVNGELDPACPTVSVVVNPELPTQYPTHCAQSLAAAAGKDTVRLGWDHIPGVAYYYVYRSTDDGATYDLRLRVDADTFEAVDAIEGGVAYRYVVVGNAHDPSVCTGVLVSAIPFFPGWVGMALATVGAVGVFVMLRRKA